MGSKFKTLALALLILLPGMAFGGNFLESWLQSNDQGTVSKPGYYKGGRYSYNSGGSVSGRIQLRNTPIFSATAPSFSVGCGGIDAFLGSYAMVDPKYLMARAQKIIDAAPYAAFDLALKVLCESCANTMKDIQNALDRLNNIQLDECAASKALVATIASPMSDNPQITEDVNNFKLSTGVSNDWTALTSDLKSTGGQVTTAEVDSLISGCQQDVKTVFGQTGSVMTRIGDRLGYPTGHIDAARAMFGDIIVLKDNGFKINFEPPCPEAIDTDLELMISGRAITKPMATITSGVCTPMNNGVQSLETHTRQLLTNVYNKVKAKGALSTAEAASMETTSLPVQSLMQLAVRTGDPTAIVDEFGRLMAMEKAYRMVNDISVVAEQATLVAQTISSKSAERKDNCRIHMLSGAIKGIMELRQRAWDVRRVAQAQYADYLDKEANFFARMQDMKEMDKKVSGELGQSLKASLFLGK